MANLSPWAITDTFTLIDAVRQIKPPATYLLDTWFPKKMPVTNTTWVSVEYSKEGRVLAPYIVKGSQGVNINRGVSKIQSYRAPMMGPRRTIGLNDIEFRQFGEQPIFSTITPEERASRMLANDLIELRRPIFNALNKQAADILQTGKMKIRGYADDGKTVEEDTIIFDWNGIVTPQVPWNQAGASIYDDIKAVSDRIQEDSGFIPTLMLCGSNVEKYLLKNTELYKWMSLPNRENLQMMSFAPRYTSPQARFIGHISALNLEIVSYAETYTDDDGKVKPFLDPNTVIIGNPGNGKQLYSAITYMNQQGDWQSVAAEQVPVYLADPKAQQSQMTIYTRCLLVPAIMEDWAVINVLSEG